MTDPPATDDPTGATVFDSTGFKIGHVGTIHVDQTTGGPVFLTVLTSDRRTEGRVVPFQGASLADSEIRVAFPKTAVESAPRIADADRALSPHDTNRLYEHYGLSGADTSGSSLGAQHDFTRAKPVQDPLDRAGHIEYPAIN